MTTGYCAAAPAAAHVFVDELADDITIAGDDGHHLQRVRRLRPGEALTVSDGLGAWRLAEVRDIGDGTLHVTCNGPLVHEPELVPRLVVAFAPAKGDQAGAVVHQLVELGADAVMPITLRRSVARVDGPRGDRALARMMRVVREAAMQSRRARLPEVLAPEPLTELARHPGVVVATVDGAPAATVAATPVAEWLVVVGPEGGFDPDEREVLVKAASLAVGPHVLRAVTAPVAAAAALAGFRAAVGPGSDEFARRDG